ncbi:3108_t:CDS:2, partial [Scutellospora calospora]
MQQQTFNGQPPEYTDNSAERKTFSGWEYDNQTFNRYNVFDIKVSECELKVRLAFVRKVYSILFAQISMSTAVAGLMIGWAMFVSFILTFVLLITLQINHRSYPKNFALLAAFTLAESYSIGTAVTYYDYNVVLRTLIVTSGLFIGIVLYTMQSKYDFSGMFPLLYNGLLLVLGISIVGIYIPFGGVFDFIFTIISIALFCAFIAYDTFDVMKTKHPEEYILAAVDLYLDFVNLFLRILK